MVFTNLPLLRCSTFHRWQNWAKRPEENRVLSSVISRDGTPTSANHLRSRQTTSREDELWPNRVTQGQPDNRSEKTGIPSPDTRINRHWYVRMAALVLAHVAEVLLLATASILSIVDKPRLCCGYPCLGLARAQFAGHGVWFSPCPGEMNTGQ